MPAADSFQSGLYPLPSQPDYRRLDAWAAHPELVDGSDRKVAAADRRSGAFEGPGIPTFFVHPTLYEVGPKWNADIYNASYREAVDVGSLANQASVFNGIGQVWAPHYRQMKLGGYYTNDSALQAQAYVAFDSAYQDVRRAFFAFYRGSARGSNLCTRLAQPRNGPCQAAPEGSHFAQYRPARTHAFGLPNWQRYRAQGV